MLVTAAVSGPSRKHLARVGLVANAGSKQASMKNSLSLASQRRGALAMPGHQFLD
jgi:hypothetical protein